MKPEWKHTGMRLINLLLYLSLCGLAGTGALLAWKLPPGSRGGGGRRVLEMSRHEWGELHFWLGVVFVVATVAHLILNWAWLRKVASRGHRWRLVPGLGIGVLLVAGLLLLPVDVQGGARIDGR